MTPTPDNPHVGKDGNVSELGTARPFAHAVSKYQKAGWGGTLPLPAKKKNPPPTGFTGHKAPYPTRDQLITWLNDAKHKRANIGIRLAGCADDFEIIGIDVDHYKTDAGKDKRGGDQLQALEARLGKLPDTWTSSARTDGWSGIRYYRVPRGLAFRGQVDKDIEAIFKGYRFAVVWPSVHPGGNGIPAGCQYWWFPPGVLPDDSGRQEWSGTGESGDVPLVADLPELPEPWIEHLSQGKMRSDDDGELDMDATVDEIYQWATDTFNEGDTNPCGRMQKSIEALSTEIREEATSHDKITKAHWHIYRLAAEGHVGWNTATAAVERVWVDDVVERDKRDDKAQIRGELFRSQINALRKVKVQVDRNIAIGAVGVPSGCTCVPVPASGADGGDPDDPTAGWTVQGGIGGGGDDGLRYVRYGSPDAPDEYRMNDDGNAEHFVALFTSPGVGPGIRWVEGYGWLVWSSGSTDGVVQPRWMLSTDGLIRRAWQRVRDRQEQYVEFLEADVNNQLQRWTAQNPGQAPSAAIKAIQRKLQSWREFAKASGNNRNSMCALDAAKALPGVTVDINALDADHRLLGVANGVIELTGDNAVVRKANAQDLITLNTNVAWLDPSEINRYGKQKWEEYLERFLPDEDMRRAAQVALGHTLIGGNPEKIFIVLKGESNTGKSTMANLCAAALGEYAMTASLTIYQNHKLNPVLAKALSRRMVVTTELSDSDKISASMLKRITGGSDTIQAELKGSNVTVERVPQFVPIVATNAVPHIDGADKALRNRLYVIPFNVVVSEAEDDKEAANVMKALGLEAVLNWLVEGYIMYRREKGLAKDLRIQAESDAFAAELDTVSTFVDQSLKKHPTEYNNPKHMWTANMNWVITIPALYEAYWRWCEQMKVREADRLDQNRFGRRVKDIGIPQKKVRIGDKTPSAWYSVRLVGRAAPKVTGIGANWTTEK